MYMREGFVRVVNRGYRSVEVQVEAIDDQGMSYGPATLNTNQQSWLRIISSGTMMAYVRIEGTDDTGAAPGT